MPWWGWILVGIFGTLFVIVVATLNLVRWFDGEDEDVDEDDVNEKERMHQEYASIIGDLRTQIAEHVEDIRQYKHEIAMMEREGVIEGLWDLEECGYWFPKGEELAAFREEYPDRVPDDFEEDGDEERMV
jgi:hypothetical protein